MAKTYTIQSSFNNGVLDPLLKGRIDLKQYYQGVEQGDNVDFLPQGGVRRRPGLEYIATADGAGRIIPFIFNVDQKYVLLFTDLQLKIYRDDALVDTLVTPYETADLFQIDFAQSADTMILVHGMHAPKTLVRGATDADFTLSNISFNYIPQFDFNDSDSPTPTSEIQTLTFTNYSEGDTYKLNLEGVDTIELSYNSDINATASDIEEALLDLANTPNTGITASGSGTVVTVTFADAAANDWRLMSGRVITATGIGTNNTITVARTQTGYPRTEDVWSNTRGWLCTVTFHESRLWFGGSMSRPNTVWGSQVNNFFDFDPGKTRDDQAIDRTLDTDQINRIQGLISNRTLQIFTLGGEFAVRQKLNDPITPENISIVRQTGLGSTKIKPIAIEGSTIFVQRTGKAVHELVYDIGQEAYDSGPLSLLASHLIIHPVQLDARRGTVDEDANRVYFVNDDGSVSVFNTLRSQNIAAWSRWQTDGNFKSVAVLLDDLYFLVEREINSSTVYYLEKAGAEVYTDSAVTYTGLGSDTLTGLTHLEGETLRVRGDGAVLQDVTVATGSATAERSITDGEVGLEFVATIKTMPAVQDLGGGFNLDDEKRITHCTLDLYETLGLYVNDIYLPDRQFGEDILDTTPKPYTGRKSTRLLGWSKTNQVTLTQPDPMPMTIRAINLEVDG